MYKLKPGIKQDPERRWALPDRVFFGHGACHILAGVYLKDPPQQEFYAERLIPKGEFPGNHIFVTNGILAFDYHGYSSRVALLTHHVKSWRRQCGDKWEYSLERVNFDLLDQIELNRRKMLGPEQYFKDPVPRARAFIRKVDHEKSATTVLRDFC
ncbi:hypothetical protein [uncultured Roseovarius sp.]|uniref:hypothetical protein n=1 Tax=uncultured Roseovarius sp. TaxID=293344 RepID=UPI00260BEE02|nr:hypothetical protein [uncultured Roseovarius sp.]